MPSRYVKKITYWQVCVNYRLGILGFLGTKTNFKGKLETGNFGLMDQYAAMYWIKDNIHYFGGDSEKMTCMGMSAGSESCAIHSVWTDSKILVNFQGMILTSNAYLPYYDENQAEFLLNQVKQQTKCYFEDISLSESCLTKIDAQELVDLSVLPPISDIGNTAIVQNWPPTRVSIPRTADPAAACRTPHRTAPA